MLRTGKKITLFLHDGLPKGVREAKIDMWTGVGFCMPRLKVKAFVKENNKEISNCVYFLIGPTKDGQSNIPLVYVGESIKFDSRLDDHIIKKDWWDTIIFYSSSDFFGKDSVLYLEKELHSELKNTDRCILKNTQQPKYDSIRREDIPGLCEFIDNIKVITPLFGYDLFESINNNNLNEQSPVVNEIFFYKGAKGRNTSDGKFMVYADTIFNLKTTNSLPENFKKNREIFLSKDLFTKNKKGYTLNRDYIFNSSSGALQMITGGTISGPGNWKKKDGKSLKQFILEQD